MNSWMSVLPTKRLAALMVATPFFVSHVVLKSPKPNEVAVFFAGVNTVYYIVWHVIQKLKNDHLSDVKKQGTYEPNTVEYAIYQQRIIQLANIAGRVNTILIPAIFKKMTSQLQFLSLMQLLGLFLLTNNYTFVVDYSFAIAMKEF